MIALTISEDADQQRKALALAPLLRLLRECGSDIIALIISEDADERRLIITREDYGHDGACSAGAPQSHPTPSRK